MLAGLSLPVKCCHDSQIERVQEPNETDSCCETNNRTVPESTCALFNFSSVSLDNCDCDHSLQKIDNSVLLSNKIDFNKNTLIVISNTDLVDTDRQYSSEIIFDIQNQRKIPIYITVSSYLI